MSFQPRTLADGRVCCEGAYLCAECKAYQASRTQGVRMKTAQKTALRTTAVCGCPKCVAQRTQQTETPYIQQPPPDGYKMALDKAQRPTYVPANPQLADIDGYAAALAKRKEAQR